MENSNSINKEHIQVLLQTMADIIGEEKGLKIIVELKEKNKKESETNEKN